MNSDAHRRRRVAIALGLCAVLAAALPTYREFQSANRPRRLGVAGGSSPDRMVRAEAPRHPGTRRDPHPAAAMGSREPGLALADPESVQEIARVAAEWALVDPRAAMRGAMALSPGGGRTEAMQRAFNRWSNQDAPAAAEWLGQNLADPDADQLIADLIGDLPVFETDPKLAASWAELISDPALRQRSLLPVISHWVRRNPAAAIEYLSTNSALSDEDRAQLLKRLTPP